VAPEGNVLGIDVSEPFITIARSEAPPNVRYLCADAQTHSFEMRFDLCLSRFGTMFFDDPAAAFANLRRALKPGGAFAAVTWGPLQQNAWVDVPLRIVRNYLPGPTTPAAGPGPFSLSDRAALERLLTGAGFAQARVVPLPLPYAGGATIEDAVAFLLQVGPPSAILRAAGEAARPLLPRIEADLREALGPFSRPHGVELPAVALLATAAATG
jgi:SAM-dependent methyltransferase